MFHKKVACTKSGSFERVKYFLKKYVVQLMNEGASYGTKSGHFTVIATGNGGPKKFLVGLHFLSHPPFVRLLEAAAREYGYQQGILAIPCDASELEQILSHV